MPPTLTASDLKEQAEARKFKMKLLDDAYMTDVGGNRGRFPRGAVLLVDEDTAYRWYENNVAEPADPEAEVYGEVKRRDKRAEFERLARPAVGAFDKAITRDSANGERQLMPPAMPVPGKRRRSDLAGAEVVTDPSDDE